MEGIPEIFSPYGNRAAAPAAPLSEAERLARDFEAHEIEESRFLARYKEVAAKSRNRMVRFLLQLIVADEERHHATTQAIASTLQADLEWSEPASPLHDLYDLDGEKSRLLQVTDDFIRSEKKGIKRYKELIKASRGYYRDLFVLLLQGKARDSEKHIKILAFLRRRLIEA